MGRIPRFHRARRSPVLGAIQGRLVDGLKQVQHEGDRAGQNHQQLGIGRSIRPGTAVPPTVLVADMGDGSLLLEGWRDGPSAYLCPVDAVPLRRELQRAFGSPDSTPSNRQDEVP